MSPLRRIARRWPWFAGLYLLLLIGSWITQAMAPRPPLPAGDRLVEVPAQGADGPRADLPPVRLAVRQWGADDAPVVLLLHGSPGGKDNFDHLGPLLADRYRAIAVDLPGYGHSSRSVPDYGIEANARYALALMDALHIPSAQVIGFSLGSGPALWMAERAPDRVTSLVFYGGIGIQEGEGSGDYHFEHLKYRVGHGLAVWGLALVPHFGLLGPTAFHVAWTRNFMDSDQRPLRAILGGLTPDTPLLILHGRDDPLVPAWTAYQHHEIVAHSELVMLDASHFLLFSADGTRRLHEHLRPFLDTHADGLTPGARRTVDLTADRPTAASPLPFGWDLRRGTGPWTQVGIIVVGTYVLEDPTTVFTGLMIAQGQVDPFVGLLGIILGIFTGDLGLYLIGFVLGRRALAWPPLARRLPTRHIERLGGWFDRHGWQAVLASRFIPGSRLPLYISAGALGRKPGRFALWTLMAVVIWSIVMLLAVVLLGSAASSPLRALFGDSWLALLAAVLLGVLAIRLLLLLSTAIGRARLWAATRRLWQWEFWPGWLMYVPVYAWIAWLCLRHRGIATATAANPGIPHGGVLDESKIDILRHLPEEAIIPSELVHDADELADAMRRRGWSYPLILKPDNGFRGQGLRKVRGPEQVAEFFADGPTATVAQVFHPGPFEAGVFYTRHPDHPTGRIFSITDKVFPEVTGDGVHTLEQLIYRHPRYSMQAGIFLRRHGDDRDRVPPAGQRVPLATAGNHCQGTMFLDGARLMTPQLEAAIDRIARHFDGFFFGRFDIRYTDPEGFRAGRDLAIVELNGLTSESTNIYDPSRSLFHAWRTLCRQWSLAFAIGAANRRRGVPGTPLWPLLRLLARHHLRGRRPSRLAD